MIRGRSPLKHRHDGTSPLPMGMDWSPPPKKWNGRDTVWPHDPRSGWSYCVTIPSWVALPKSRSSASDPVVFYRVQVGIQSPEGITTIRGVLRRFNDFLKLFSDLKKAFPRKSLPSAPPKGLLRMKSRALLEERRCSLEDWISRLLSDIDLSRSMPVASFLELEAAARSSFQDASQPPSETNPSPSSSLSSGQVLSALAGSSSAASDYGSDTAYETSELGSPSFGRDDGSEVGLDELTLDEDLPDPMEKLVKYSMSNIDEGLLMGESILDQLEAFKQQKVHNRQITGNGSASNSVNLGVERAGSFFESDRGKVINHTRKASNESVGSDLSSHRGSEVSNSWTPDLLGESSLDVSSVAEASRTMSSPISPELQFLNGGQIALPRDQQPKLDRILTILQRRLVTAKTDMEDLITRLNQEVAVKEYLSSKVKDLEVELETTKEKCKETIQQALSLEKERITKMQWDMEELRRKSLELELKLKSQQDGELLADSPRLSAFPQKDGLVHELEATKDQLNLLIKQREELEMQSKSDIKVLVKEVKSLRRSQNDLMQKLDKSLQEKSELEKLLQKEKEQSEHVLAARSTLLHDCRTLQSRLQECNINFVQTDLNNSSYISSVLDLLTESDKQLSVLLAETQLLAPEVETILDDDDDLKKIDRELRLLLRDIFLNNAKLREQVNIFIRSALQLDSSTNGGGKDGLLREIVLKQLLET